MLRTARAHRLNAVIHWSVIYLVSEWIIRIWMLIYVPQRRSAAASRTWLLLIFLLPWPGILLYALFGRIYVSRKRIEHQKRASEQIRTAQAQMGPRVATKPPLPPALEPIVPLAASLGDFEPFAGNQVQLLTDYDGFIQNLINDIDDAQHHVHLLIYIYGNDATANRVTEALVRAAKRGVTCRVMLDAVGSKIALKKCAAAMRAQGIEVLAMLPVGLFRRNAARFDLRNHRKIVVIDGRIGYTGSQNIVDPNFVPGYPNEELNVRVMGPIVAQLQAVFLADHYFETDQRLSQSVIFPPLEPIGSVCAQIVPSGPGYQRENAHELFITLLYYARERVVLATPYFVPDDPFLQAITSAARRGVAVHLIVSKHANQLVTQLAQRSYYDQLLEAGVCIHLYKSRFLHAKHLTIDDDIALFGSTNIDIRSFALNAEINLLVYDRDIVAQLRTEQVRYLSNSHHLELSEWSQRSLGERTIQGVARLADSLL